MQGMMQRWNVERPANPLADFQMAEGNPRPAVGSVRSVRKPRQFCVQISNRLDRRLVANPLAGEAKIG
jgi:hypothetical protein